MRRVDVDVRFGRRGLGVSKTWVQRIISQTLRIERRIGFKVGVLLTDNRGIQKINREFLKHDAATDVISFGLGPESLGDIVVSVQMAKAMAKKLGISFREELARYLVHGTLHLLGYRDKVFRDKTKMWKKQEFILRGLLGYL